MPRPRRIHRPLRVAFVCAQLEIGGQESGMLEVLRRLDRRRFQPVLYTFRGGPLLSRVRRLGVRVVIGQRHSGAPESWTRADSRAKATFRRRLAAALRADRIDVCLVYAWADALPAAREAGVPAIVERVDGPKLIGWVRDKSSCQRIICESASIARLIRAQAEWLRCERVPIAVIRNGVDLERFDPHRYDLARSRAALGLRHDDFVVGAVARLAPVKNLDHLLEAARLLIDRLAPEPRVRILIAGPDGGAGAALRKKARELGLASHVRFLGARTDVPNILRALDVFVLTSIQEGMPFALLEAMAMGLPVIASQADSIAESMQDNAFLVGPLDPYRTTMAMRHLMSSPGLRTTLGRRSRRIASRHGLARMVNQYERVLEAAFRAGRQRPRFRRRIAVVAGHAGSRSSRACRALETLSHALRADRADVYALLMSADIAGDPTWPPSRRQWFAPTTAGRLARNMSLEWIQPDVVITDCPRVVAAARHALPGEEILFFDNPDDPCPRRANARRIADHVLPLEDAGRVARLRRLLST